LCAAARLHKSKQRPVRPWRDARPAGAARQVWSWLEESGLEISTACMNAYVSALVKQVRLAAAVPQHARSRARRAAAPAAVQAAPASVLTALLRVPVRHVPELFLWDLRGRPQRARRAVRRRGAGRRRERRSARCWRRARAASRPSAPSMRCWWRRCGRATRPSRRGWALRRTLAAPRPA